MWGRVFQIIILISLFSFSSKAQVNVFGVINDQKNEALTGVTIKVLNSDSSLAGGAVSDFEGKFSLSLKPENKYMVQFIFLSYKTINKTIELKSENLDLGTIKMKEESKTLAEVEVKGTQTRGQQKGDTTQFNADAYKTNPDATAEDLVKKMPGVTSDNNGLKVNGESVQKVLLDGKPFFGDDPSAAVKNLPADLIDKVEVFDKMSDQSQFTGFNDGNQQKTINLVTKKGKNTGQFGKIYAGGGADENSNTRYNAGATINSFQTKRRLTFLLLSNNINQQNFSISDITGAMGSSGGGNRGSGGGGRGGNNQGSSLLTSPQNGITATQSAGLNYTDEWGKKIKVSGSYFFNYSDNKNRADLSRNYFSSNNMVYRQSNEDQTKNLNHRFNFRFEYAIDSANKLTITPSLNFQNTDYKSSLIGSNTILDSVPLSSTKTNSGVKNIGYDFSNNILYQHKFIKPGRTISFNLTTQLTEKNSDGNYNSQNIFTDTTTSLDQVYSTYSNSRKISGSISWTEPLTKFSQLQLNYSPSYNEGLSDKVTDDYDTITKEYSYFNSSLSNKYNNIYETERGGLSYKYNKNKINLSIGADVQQSTLTGDQTFPVAFGINQSFKNILPNAWFNYKFNKVNNLRVNYRSSTNIPSISQLQSVIDISNPLQIQTGNTGLKQTFENSLNIRFGGFNPTSSKNAMVFMNLGVTDNYITNSTTILNNDSVVQGYTIKKGSQITRPVNLDGYYNGRLFFVYGFPVKAIKSNMNFNGGVNYGHTPAINNNIINYANSYATNGGVFIGSNVSQNLDFSIGYTANYTIVKNTNQTTSDNNFFSHNASFKINWILFKGLVLNTDVTHTLYNGLTQSFNQDYYIWNAYIGYKFLKNKSLEAKISAFDILNQNRSISRTVTGNYTEDNYTVVLKRYLMGTLTYTLKHFKGEIPENKDKFNFGPGQGPGQWPNGPGNKPQ